MDVIKMYCEEFMSIPEISNATGIALSTVRYKLKKANVLRSRSDALRLAGKNGKLGSGLRGKKRIFTDQWKKNISIAKIEQANKYAAGVSLKPSGYIEITRGENKGRGQHIVVMEKIIGRRLYANEVVHHIDHNRKNNLPENLKLMTRSEHCRLHAIENSEKRERTKDGKFK